MFCDNCGSNLPDGGNTCPNCGRKVYNSSEMDDLLSELSLAIDGLSSEEDTQPNPEATRVIPELPVISDESDTIEEPAQPEADDAAALPELDDAAELFDAEPEQSLVGNAFAAAAEEVEPAPAAPARKKAAASRKTSTGKGTASKKTSSSAKKSSGKKKKKKKKKSGGSGVLGVVIGLLIALLLIAGAAGFMLYKMGFFSAMNTSDDQLLARTSAQEAAITTLAPEAVETEPLVTLTPASEAAALAEASVAEEPAEEEPVVVTSFELTGDDTIYLYSRGTTEQIEYALEPKEAAADIEWTSSDESIATVSEAGVISARRGGTCEITGTCGEFTVTVEVSCQFTVPDTVLDMNFEDVTMDHEGQTLQLEISSDDLTLAQKGDVVWESSDEEVATVDESGLVTAVGDGTAVISGACGENTASCIIRCVGVSGNVGVNSEKAPYTINFEDVTLSRKGEYFQLKISSITGDEVPTFVWKSDDTDVATVDQDGVVTAVSNGTASVTCTVDDFKFECIVRVSFS